MINVVDIFGDIVRRLNEKVGFPINYIFGDADYIGFTLNAMLQTPETAKEAYPFICLYSPFDEDKTDRSLHCKTSLDFIIAVNTQPDYTNEQRKEISFKPCLQPIYESFIGAIFEDKRLDFGYQGAVSHHYSDNYRYGRNTLKTPQGELLKHRIDAIDLTRVQINLKKEMCK